jgi:hypothetical protein
MLGRSPPSGAGFAALAKSSLRREFEKTRKKQFPRCCSAASGQAGSKFVFPDVAFKHQPKPLGGSAVPILPIWHFTDLAF